MKAAILMWALLAAALPAAAGDDHGHDQAAPAVNTTSPSRLPDGSVFLPKETQRQLGVRTVQVRADALARTVALAGRVTTDPNAGGKVQAMTAGRIDGGQRGLPAVGQAVRKGQVLAHVVASAAPIERANQAAQLAELRASRDLAAQRLARLQALSDTVPRKDIEAAASELASLQARAAAVGAGLLSREALLAPVSGVIAAAHVVAGQVVDARELVFDIVDPSRLTIEAQAFDLALASDVGSASLALGDQPVALQFVGAGRLLREQALPLTFKAQGAALSQLAVGQPVQVFVQTKRTVQAIAVPAASLMKNAANQTIVWVKTAPERFAPRVVTAEPLDGVRVAVTAGLAANDRVATQGAALIHQIR